MRKPPFLRRRTKIVCTIGPATDSASRIEHLVRGGMNVARLNLSHGTYETHARSVEIIRKVSQRLGVGVAVLMDLPGPKYRIGKLRGGKVTLRKGALMALTTRDMEGDDSCVPVNLPNLPQDIKLGDTILLDDGAMRLRVTGKTATDVKCRVIVGGVLTERRGLVVPGMESSAPFISQDLKEHLAFALEQKPDYLAISFVRNAEDVAAVRTIVRQTCADVPIISKIEQQEAVRDFDAILSGSDGIMVARGDLGVQIPLERVPLVQKDIIRKCNRAGKPVITATQMLESMVNAAAPTRAEVTDVANAIFDGSDAVMLSAETSIGKYPLAAVRMMAKIARETEKKLPYERMMAERSSWIQRETDELISYSACHTAAALGAKAVVAFTQSGSTARRVSKYRAQVPVIAITPDLAVRGRLLLHWGVYPVYLTGAPATVEQLFSRAAEMAMSMGLARPGDLIVITGGVPVGVAGTTNMLKVEKIAWFDGDAR